MRRLVPTLVASIVVLVPIAVVAGSPPASAAPASLAGESFAGTDVLTGQCPPPGDAGSLPFTASGTASGPYPGTFTETGYWELDLEVLSAFHSSFTITSGATTVTGSTDFTVGTAFAACDGRAYSVPTQYTGMVTDASGTSPVSGPSTVDISYGTFARTFGGASVSGFAIATTSLPPATPGSPYTSQTLVAGGLDQSAAGYSTTLKWGKGAVIAPAVALPQGMKLSSAGVLSGTPSRHLESGQSHVVVKVTETVTTLNGSGRTVKTRTTVQSTIPLTIT